MTANDKPAAHPHKDAISPPVDAVFDFSVTEWLDAPLYVSDLPETSPETNLRVMNEQEYRKSTTPFNWHRYFTLGRYAVDGFTFDASMDDIVADPLKIHCIVWYNYMYHIDHGIDIPAPLLNWATLRSHQYLCSHADSALIIDTKKVTWKHYARIHSLSDNWSTAQAKNRKTKPSLPQNPVSTLPTNHDARIRVSDVDKASTVPASSLQSVLLSSPRGTKRASNSTPIPESYSEAPSKTTEGTDPSLITTLNVKVCDGTKRVTFRLKLNVDEFRLFRVPATMKDAVYKFLNKIYGDDDGCLFDWSNHGTDKFGTISQMTPQQVRQFICPSITIMPDASMVILPLRFGYAGISPSKWRNLESTQATLDEYNATVSFSNATSTSGKLVIAGYVLYKAPMTTHRKRWLDYLRTQLDEDTPPFDVLLHKRPPTGDKGKVLPHLAIQCGESHVHSLSEALAAYLTGDKSPLYLPRFSFEKMTSEEAYEIFLDHDAYVKDLRSLPLSPLLRNLDRLRKEHHTDGSAIERSAREWARHLTNPDGSSMQADVVNGGDDLLCYLVFPSAFYDSAIMAVDQYRSALYPFTHREARFRESIGPPPEVHLSKRVIANLDFVKKRIAARRASPSVSASLSAEDSVSTTSSVSQISRPMTPAESLRLRYRNHDQVSEASSSHASNSNDSTSHTTAASSKSSTGQISSQSAQFRDFQSALSRQKKMYEKQETQVSDRFATIERQLYRFNDLDTKLEDVQTDFSSRLNLLEGRILQSVKDELTKSSTSMETRMDKLMTAVESVVVSQKGITAATKVLQKSASSSRSGSSSNESKSSSAMSVESIAIVKSPEQKRLKSRERKSKKYPLKDSIRRSLDNLNPKITNLDSPMTKPSEVPLPLSDSDESMEHLYRQMDELAQHTSCPEQPLKTDVHDLESQYTASHADTTDNIATTSPGRRKFRSSPIDPLPSASFGDPIQSKVKGSIRIFFQNVKGLTHSNTLEDYRYYHQCLQGLSVNIIGLAETNTCWSHHHLSSDFRIATQRFHRQSKIIFGSVSPAIDPCLQHESFQSGGNVTAVFDDISSRVAGPSIVDPTGLGRWSGVTIEGTQARKLSIITAYRVCKGSPQSAPLGSSFLREYEFFRERSGTSVNPRRQFLCDLQKLVLALQESGHCVIIMLDANSTIDDKDLATFVASCGLHDCHSLAPSPSTYIGSSDRRIDFIFGCDEALQLVIRSGILAYTEGPQSDHRGLYVDISHEFIARTPWSTATPSAARHLHTGNPELVEKYNLAMLDYYGKHRMVERIEDLYQRHRQMPREELRAALISWDQDQGRSMESSERLLKRPPQKCQWSPALRNSAILRRYWMLRLRECLHGKIFQSTFLRWQTQVQQSDPKFLLPSLGIRLSVDQIRHELTQANNRFRRLQKISTPLRLQCYEDLLDTYLEDTNPATQASSRRKAKIVMNTISGETTRTTFGHIRRITKPSERSSLSKVLVPPSSMAHESGYSAYQITHEYTDIPWETVFTREELEQHILDYNKESFRAASESPCGHGIIHDALTFTSLSPQSEDLLSGIVPEHWHGSDNYLREFLASFVIPMHVRTYGDIPTGISSDEVIRGFKGWKEQTSTSPSGRHLGHYRALIQDPILLKCFVYFINIVVARGIAIPRWCRATNVMIEKDAGKPCINRLRIVHLFEADFNFFLKLQWGHRLVRHACELDLLHDSQHGSIPRRTAIDPIMLTQLTTDLCRVLRHDMARFDNDASACYDRIIVALGMLAARRCGMPKNAVRLHAEALQFMRYTVKTAYGVSESNYSGTPFAPLFGTGQGSGASPAVWLSLVVLLLHAFDRIVPHRMHFDPIAGGRSHSRSSDAFVDDTSVGFTSNDGDSYSDLIARLEYVAQSWEKLLYMSGGKLNLKKCSFFVLQWEWQHGRPILRRMIPNDPSISLTQGQSSTRHAIKQTSPTESIRMLGVFLNPMGDFTDHLAALKEKADTFARRLRSPRLTETDVAIFHRSIYIPSMRYSLAALATNEEELSKVQSQISRVILQRLHIRSTIPTALRYGPLELGGLGLYDLRTEMGIETLKFLRNALYSDSEAGNLIRLNLDYSQREAGVDFHLLEQPNRHVSYLTPSWILSVRQFLGNNNMHLQISDLHLDPLHGPKDEYIMQSDHLTRYTPAQQQDLNLVRLWLQVATLADMCDPDRSNRILLCYLDGNRPSDFEPSPKWPRQAQPSKSQQRLWKRFIRSSYLRYPPYWKVPQEKCLTPSATTVPSQSFPDLPSYIASLSSRTERRLLDGLQQKASDLQVWRAFRSKSRLHLASDGGLSKNSATHGWILSTGRHVLFTCSGPVDGPNDTHSSTRSEIGGCASALLLLSSLSAFWGLKHRCSFNWYTDSRSAISRFHTFCGRRRSIRMPSDADLLSIISSSLRVLKRSFRPIWVKAHQDVAISYDRLPLPARLNIDADFLATRYREHGRLRSRSLVDHRQDNGSTLYINGSPVTGHYDECVRFHVNGYHQRAEIQKTEQWNDTTWDLVDFHTFGNHFRKLRPTLRTQHFKFIHEVLPLGVQRFREASIKDAIIKLCPCCKVADETPHHFLRCTANPAFASSLSTLRSDILTHDSHPTRYLIVEGICHVITSDSTFAPDIHQYPTHFHPGITSALSSQQQIGWNSAVKGFLAREWSELATLDMHTPYCDPRVGNTRMQQIISALCQHTRRLWIARNGCLHDSTSGTHLSSTAEAIEIKYYHSRPHLLRTGDQHYCQRSLSKLLEGPPATRRRWLRKVKKSSAELTKDGTTRQSLITSFFSPV